MLNTREWRTCYNPSKDQPILNYLVWSGKAREARIKYRFIGCDGGLMTLQWCVVNKEVRFTQFGQVLSPSNTVPAYLHQYPPLDGLREIQCPMNIVCFTVTARATFKIERRRFWLSNSVEQVHEIDIAVRASSQLAFGVNVTAR
jgi:hypothetical protein